VQEVKAVLDIQVSKIQRGDYGYVVAEKKRNLKLSLILLIACIIVFTIGLVLNNEITVVMNLISILLILPIAQFLAKYFSFFTYKPLDQEMFETIDKISEHFLVLGEMPLVRGKKTYFIKVMTISECGVHVLVDPGKNSHLTRQTQIETKAMLMSIISPKGFKQEVNVYTDIEAYIKDLRTIGQSSNQKSDENHLAKVAKAFLLKTQ